MQLSEIKLCISNVCKALLNSCSVFTVLVFPSNLDQITTPKYQREYPFHCKSVYSVSPLLDISPVLHHMTETYETLKKFAMNGKLLVSNIPSPDQMVWCTELETTQPTT